jgi:hypothetical protein
MAKLIEGLRNLARGRRAPAPVWPVPSLRSSSSLERSVPVMAPPAPLAAVSHPGENQPALLREPPVPKEPEVAREPSVPA